MRRRRCYVDGCTNREHAGGLCSAHYHRVRRHGSVLEDVPLGAARHRLVPLPEEPWTCTCSTPVDPSPIGECQRCYRPVEEMLTPGARRPFDELIPALAAAQVQR